MYMGRQGNKPMGLRDYFSGTNIMAKLTDNNPQQIQMAFPPRAGVRILPSPAPKPNTRITPK